MTKANFIATLMILQGFIFFCVQAWYFPYSCSYDNGNYNVSWTYNETSDRLYFKVEVSTTGWVGFGLANEAPTNMTDYDVAVGGVYDNGSCYLKDYLTIGRMQPQLDLQQDWILINCSEDNGVTTLFFCRAKNTGDENDTVVEEGKSIYIIWAYHDTTDVTDMSFPQHTAQGFDNKTLCPGATITYKPKAGQCQQVCCDGAGGEMTVVPACTPADKCEGIVLPAEKKEDGHCPGDSKGTCSVDCDDDDDDSGGLYTSPSFAVVILLAFTSFIKTTFY